MMDVSEKGSGSENGGMKVCADCKTSKTPLWRGGPEGPKSLCNACGIRHRKQRRALLGLNNKGVGTTEKKKIKKKERTKNEVSLKLKLIRVGKKVLLKRSSGLEKQNKLGEVEQAAILLMALSCGCVYG